MYSSSISLVYFQIKVNCERFLKQEKKYQRMPGCYNYLTWSCKIKISEHLNNCSWIFNTSKTFCSFTVQQRKALKFAHSYFFDNSTDWVLSKSKLYEIISAAIHF